MQTVSVTHEGVSQLNQPYQPKEVSHDSKVFDKSQKGASESSEKCAPGKHSDWSHLGGEADA